MAYISNILREFVHKRAKTFCEYCYASEAILVTMHIDHIRPVAKDGQTDRDNLALTCAMCNQSKSDFETGIDPESDTEVPLFNPRTQNWRDHFYWSDDGTHILGKTPIGRATINRLDMNRPRVIRAREIWLKGGWKPPTN